MFKIVGVSASKHSSIGAMFEVFIDENVDNFSVEQLEMLEGLAEHIDHAAIEIETKLDDLEKQAEEQKNELDEERDNAEKLAGEIEALQDQRDELETQVKDLQDELEELK